MPDFPNCSALWISAGCAMLYFVCIGVSVGFLVFACRQLLSRRGPVLRYRLTLTCLLALAICPVVLWPCIRMRVESQSHAPAGATTSSILGSDEPLPDGWSEDSAAAGSGSPVQPLVTPSHPIGERIIVSSAVALLDWMSLYGPYVWMSGLLVMASLTVGGLLASRQVGLCARPENGDIQARADAICASMGLRPVPIKLTDAVSSPLLMGFLRPAVLLPAEPCRSWTADQLEMVLIHELTHARRRDNYIILLERACEVVFFFNPAVWRLSRWLKEDREEICDGVVLARTGSRPAYVELLLHLASRRPTYLVAAGMGEHNLVTRVRSILESDLPARASCGKLLSIACALAVATFSAGVIEQVSAVPMPLAGRIAADSSPAMESSTPRQAQPEPAIETSVAPVANAASFLLLDESGRAVAGARAAANLRQTGGVPNWQEADVRSSDGRGVVSYPVPAEPGVMTQVYFREPNRQLVGAAELISPAAGPALPVAMAPACRVVVKLQIDGGESLTWAKCFVRLPDSDPKNPRARKSDGYLLRQTEISDSAGPWIFEFDLPPGHYQFVALAGDEQSKVSRVQLRVQNFEVPSGVSRLDYGDLKVCMKPSN